MENLSVKDSYKRYLFTMSVVQCFFFLCFYLFNNMIVIYELNSQQISNGIYSAKVMESKELIIKNHPILTFFYREFLDVREKTDGNNDDPSISKHSA